MKKTYFRIALKNLNRQKKRSILLGGAIVFGILIITLMNGLSVSFLKGLNANFSQLAAGHIFISRQEKTASGRTDNVIRDDREFSAIIDKEQKNIQTRIMRSQVSGLLISGRENYNIQVEGVDWTREAGLEKQIVLKEGTWEEIKQEPRSIILEQKISKKLHVDLNDVVVFKMETMSGQINVIEFILKGIAADKGILGSLSAYAAMATVNAGLNIPADAYTSVNLYLNRDKDIDAAANRLLAGFKAQGLQTAPRYDAAQAGTTGDLTSVLADEWDGVRYQVMTINDITRTYKSLSDGLNAAGFVILGILFIIIMVGLTNSYRMVLYERIREIGTMRALGMQKSGVRTIFYLEALFLCLLSLCAGILIAFGILIAVSLITFGDDNVISLFTQNGHIAFTPNLPMMLLNAGFLIFIIMIAIGFTARKAARLEPAHALRTYI